MYITICCIISVAHVDTILVMMMPQLLEKGWL